jgi:hypothetical protein
MVLILPLSNQLILSKNDSNIKNVRKSKIFIRNLDNFSKMNLGGFLATVYEIIVTRK